jgi:hypothetical protein
MWESNTGGHSLEIGKYSINRLICAIICSGQFQVSDIVLYLVPPGTVTDEGIDGSNTC